MSDYRFKLQKYTPGSKITCPKCHRKRCATRYIDTLGEITFPDEVCICDRINKCGYHYPPKEYFRDNPEVLKELMGKEHGDMGLLETRKNATPVKTSNISSSPIAPPSDAVYEEKPVSFVDSELVNQTFGHYHLNPLFRFLATKLGNEEVERIFRLYNVGTSRQWNGSTVYWYRDIQDSYRSGKVMGYDPTNGHRIKKPYNQVTWSHSLLKLPDFNMNLCLFGEHLIANCPNKKVAIVEAEKTCLIATHFLPEYIWLATGGIKTGFKPDVMNVLVGREVVLFPDLGGYHDWNKHLPLLQSICQSVTVSHYLEDIATDEQREQGLDIGDFLLFEETKREILARMIQRNPALQLLIEKLDLELIED